MAPSAARLDRLAVRDRQRQRHQRRRLRDPGLPGQLQQAGNLEVRPGLRFFLGTCGQTGFAVFSCVLAVACLESRTCDNNCESKYPGAIYHFMARGNGRQDIVCDDHDRQRLMDELARCVNRTSGEPWGQTGFSGFFSGEPWGQTGFSVFSGNPGVRPGSGVFSGEPWGQTRVSGFFSGTLGSGTPRTLGSDRGNPGVRPGFGFFLAFWRLACLNRRHATTIANPIPWNLGVGPEWNLGVRPVSGFFLRFGGWHV